MFGQPTSRAATGIGGFDHVASGPLVRSSYRAGRLYAQTKTAFLVKRLMAAIEFRLDANGKVTGLVFHDANGKTYVAKVQ